MKSLETSFRPGQMALPARARVGAAAPTLPSRRRDPTASVAATRSHGISAAATRSHGISAGDAVPRNICVVAATLFRGISASPPLDYSDAVARRRPSSTRRPAGPATGPARGACVRETGRVAAPQIVRSLGISTWHPAAVPRPAPDGKHRRRSLPVVQRARRRESDRRQRCDGRGRQGIRRLREENGRERIAGAWARRVVRVGVERRRRRHEHRPIAGEEVVFILIAAGLTHPVLLGGDLRRDARADDGPRASAGRDDERGRARGSSCDVRGGAAGRRAPSEPR